MVMMDTMNIRRDLPWLLAVLAPTCTSLLSCSSTQEAPPAQAEAVHSHPTETKEERTLSEADARKNFDVAWRSMSEAGALSDMTDEDWEELRVEYEPQATAARNNKELRAVLDAMIQRLGKSHFSIIAQDAVEMPSPSSGGAGTLGLQARFVENQAIITQVKPDSAADEAGVRPGWLVQSVDGFDLESFSKRFGDIESASMSGYHRNSALASMLTGTPGEESTFDFIDLEGHDQQLSLKNRIDTTQVIKFGNLPPMSVSTTSSILDQKKLAEYGVKVDPDYTVGLLQFSVWMIPIVQPINAAIDAFRSAEVDAVIIDLRGNPGGLGGLAMGIGGHFTPEPTNLGTMFNEFGELNFNTNPQRISPSGELVEPLDIPLVILVDDMSASTSEIFAGGLQCAKRASIVGRRTPGMALPAVAESLPNGDILYHAIAEFELPDGRSVEGVGISPDHEVSLEQESFAGSRDPDIQTAVEWTTRSQAATDE
jgi:carboxyl-terminal processing protease